MYSPCTPSLGAPSFLPPFRLARWVAERERLPLWGRRLRAARARQLFVPCGKR